MIRTSRIVIIFIVLAALVTVCGSTLYKLQVMEGEQYLEDSTGSLATTATVNAARGSILDCNGNLLVSDRTVYNIRISRAQLLKEDDPNSIVLSIINAAKKYGVEYGDSFPVTKSGPFAYAADMTSTQSSRLADYRKYFKLKDDISAPDFIAWLRNHYGISYTTTAEDARAVIGVRYELELRAIINISDYTFASGVGVDFITYVSEQHYACVSVEPSSVREYHTKYAAHLLGNIGRMSAAQYEQYKALGYSMNASVGQSGAESAFEQYLHGTDGVVTTYTDASGAVTNVVTEKEAQAGDNVYLTADISLQAVAEESLADRIAAMNAARTEGQEKAEAGAVVVMDVKTAGVKVLASYPTYDPATYSSNYAALSADERNPLFDRATDGTYNPGSTFKMVTAMAGLKTGTITPSTTFTCTGKFTKYNDYQPKCWVYPGNHGTLNVVGALENSCNFFFFSLGDSLGADAIADWASRFGLGQNTGIEIGDSAGILYTPEYKQNVMKEGWWAADTLLVSIGQGNNMFTPLQIANYVSTIANGGTLYSATVLDRVVSHDYSSVVLRKTPTVRSIIDDSDGSIGVVQAGMKAVAATGTASSAFKDYPIPVAAKTGTVQSDTATMNTGVFVCYAPADDPQIAIAVVVEKGGSGSALTSIAKDILDAYFSTSTYVPATPSENTLTK